MSRIALFEGLEQDELGGIAGLTPAAVQPKGTVVTAPHKASPSVYFIKAGAVRLYRIDEEGREVTVDVLGTGHLFGEGSLFGNGPGGLFAVTLEESVICVISREALQEILEARPQLAIRFIGIVTDRLREAEELLSRLAYGSVRKRLLYLLAKLAGKFGTPAALRGEPDWVRLQVDLTHQELASMTGSTRETVTAALGRLTADGILYRDGTRGPLHVHPGRARSAMEGECGVLLPG
ncbi:CRP/FNR family transcriptional regulator [Paenibacillus mucilaginosus]|uniref:Crp/Fnr family transcriptional regulator n=1 Tax=Paenibacillus mucilaginosus TaxID=61624 RepID=UPI003D24AD12